MLSNGSCDALPTYAWRPRILLAFSSGAMCSMLVDVVVVIWKVLGYSKSVRVVPKVM